MLRNDRSSAFGIGVQVASERLFKCFRNTQQEQQVEIEQLQASLKVAKLAATETSSHAGLFGEGPGSIGVMGCLLGLLFAKRSKDKSKNEAN